MSAPYLLNDKLQSPIVASTYTDRIVLSGKRERWEAFYMKPARWRAVPRSLRSPPPPPPPLPATTPPPHPHPQKSVAPLTPPNTTHPQHEPGSSPLAHLPLQADG